MRGEKGDNVDYLTCWRERLFFSPLPPSPSPSSDITDSSPLY